MFLLGAKANQPPSGAGEILECLDEVRRTGAIFKIEDAQGREVPARLEHLSPLGVALRPADPLDLGPGDDTNLIYILNDYRFKAPTRVLVAGPGGVSVALPAVFLGYAAVVLTLVLLVLTSWSALAARASSGKVDHRFAVDRSIMGVLALLGLFSPMAAAAALPEPATTYAYEPGSQAVALEHRPTGETRSVRSEPPVEGLFRPGPAAGPGLLDTYLHDWLQNRASAVAGPTTGLGPGVPVPTSLVHGRHGGLLAHGVSFHFVPCSLPAHWLGSARSANVSFEAHIDRHNVQLGIRLK